MVMASSCCLSTPFKIAAPAAASRPRLESSNSSPCAPISQLRGFYSASPSLLRRRQRQVVCMAPEEERLTRRSPAEFPIEWERPKPGRRPDILPKFSPMKTPLPPPMPTDPPLEEEEEEEEEEREEEEKPEKEEKPMEPEGPKPLQ